MKLFNLFFKRKVKEKSWEELTLPEKRVLIAKDVIAQIDANIFVAQTGCYVKDLIISNEEYYESLKECNLDIKSNYKNIKKCKVCAIGSLFLATIRNTNHFKFSDLSFSRIYLNDSLDDLFSKEQLYLIECAFERTAGDSWIQLFSVERYDYKNIEKGNLAKNKYHNIVNPEVRLRLIMQNIIDNNGTFVL